MVRVLVSSASIKVFSMAIRTGSLRALTQLCTWGNSRKVRLCHFKVLKTKFYSHKQL